MANAKSASPSGSASDLARRRASARRARDARRRLGAQRRGIRPRREPAPARGRPRRLVLVVRVREAGRSPALEPLARARVARLEEGPARGARSDRISSVALEHRLLLRGEGAEARRKSSVSMHIACATASASIALSTDIAHSSSQHALGHARWRRSGRGELARERRALAPAGASGAARRLKKPQRSASSPPMRAAGVRAARRRGPGR